MAAPNRITSIENALRKLGSHVNVPLQQVDERRRQFLPHFWEELPDKQDWALMLKHDRGDVVTSDIMWHKPTMEHIDVTTHTDTDPSTIKAVWINQGVHNNQRNGTWVPIEVADAIAQGKVVKFPTDDTPPPPSNDDNTEVLKKLDQILAAITMMVPILDQILNKPFPTPPEPIIRFPNYIGRIFGIAITLRPDPPNG